VSALVTVEAPASAASRREVGRLVALLARLLVKVVEDVDEFGEPSLSASFAGPSGNPAPSITARSIAGASATSLPASPATSLAITASRRLRTSASIASVGIPAPPFS